MSIRTAPALLVSAGIVLFALHAARAQELASFAVPDDDGYGVDSCLESDQGGCGTMVATAWCTANGYSQAVSFRPAQPADLTGSITKPTQVAAGDQHTVIITCER